ncbi:hypothetical protein B0T18DRAFT_411489 [Schizothecium vesticola]|uniref:Cytochrome c oxidase assembly factor 3 n=1 Tax=Schizothecium vesticola TaxID=314040 RepID=A0AA40K567_9PEZI|nr:hypothetical protein B0T18DRAFT_411489 [Schizothecium vesticola]
MFLAGTLWKGSPHTVTDPPTPCFQLPEAVMAGIQRGSYYRDNRHAPALVRARRPYLVKNTLWGLGLFAFTIGIYTYTINAVGQDEFTDVKVPDVPASKAASDVQGQKN